jgi:hypothetical protein
MKILRIRGSDDLKLPLLFGSDQDDDTRDIRMVFLQLRETGVQHLGIIEGILDERPEYSLREKCLLLQEAVDRSLEFPQKIVGIEKNHTDAIETMLSVPEAFDECRIFNVSADSEQRNIDVAKHILSILGKPESLLTFVKDRPGHDWRYALDSSDTRSLGWKPAVSFQEGLEKTVDWYRQRLR